MHLELLYIIEDLSLTAKCLVKSYLMTCCTGHTTTLLDRLVGTAAGEHNQALDSAEVVSFSRRRLAVCTSVLTCWSLAQICCTMHPVHLKWAAFVIFLGMPTVNIFQPGVCARRRPASAVPSWQVFSTRNRISLNPASE